jgi:uncharacterized protein (TIGR03067 family)
MSKGTEALNGIWQYTSLEVEGKAKSKASLAATSITIENDRFVVSSPDESYQGTFTVDESKTPHHIDMTFTEGPQQGMCLGIYELGKATLKICLAMVGGERPKTFASKPNSGHALETLRRASAKPVASSKARTTAPELPPPKFSDHPELATIQGTWAMLSGRRDGQDMPVDGVRRVTKGNETTVTANGHVFLSARISIDPTQAPKTIDYLLTSGQARGKTQLGIYQLDGDRLTVCFARPNQKRPTDFTAPAGSGRTLSVWKPA